MDDMELIRRLGNIIDSISALRESIEVFGQEDPGRISMVCNDNVAELKGIMEWIS